MPRQLNPKAGAILGDHVDRLGIRLLRKAVTREIVGEGRVEGVLLEDGSRIPADLVVIATGIRANSSLARQAGLKVNRGVVVDNRLRASHPDVFAAGDIAEHDGVVYGLWTVSQAQGAIVGMNLAGASAEFGGLPRFNTLKVLGLDLASMGQIMPEDARDQVIDEEKDGSYFCFVFREDRLVGAILLGEMDLVSVTKRAVESRRDCAGLLRTHPSADAVLDCLRATAERDRRTPGSMRPASVAKSASSFEAVRQDGPKRGRSTLGKLATAHRLFGYVFLAIYVVLMWQMVPRLWAYQIEFPARTVVHMSLGMAIGVILVLKIAVVRFFKRLDAALVPALGTSLLVASVVLIGIAVPPAFREALATGRLFEEENRRRVEGLLLQTGLDRTQSAELSTPKSLRAGQRVLRRRCVECHDLRTVLAQPRTPDAWRQTVRRMAARFTLADPLTDQQQWQVTAYLVALSPQLQRSVRQLRDEQERRDETKQAAADMTAGGEQPSSYDPVVAKQLFETKCSECHEATLVDEDPPDSEAAAQDLVSRMVDEGLTASEEELSQIVRYLVETYVNESEP
jgi:mono/diheme cytochrome c family protein